MAMSKGNADILYPVSLFLEMYTKRLSKKMYKMVYWKNTYISILIIIKRWNQLRNGLTNYHVSYLYRKKLRLKIINIEHNFDMKIQ